MQCNPLVILRDLSNFWSFLIHSLMYETPWNTPGPKRTSSSNIGRHCLYFDWSDWFGRVDPSQNLEVAKIQRIHCHLSCHPWRRPQKPNMKDQELSRNLSSDPFSKCTEWITWKDYLDVELEEEAERGFSLDGGFFRNCSKSWGVSASFFRVAAFFTSCWFISSDFFRSNIRRNTFNPLDLWSSEK